MQTFGKSLLAILIIGLLAAGIYSGMLYLNELGFFDRDEPIIEEVVEEDDALFPFIVPMEGPEVTPAVLTFRFMGEDYEVQAQVDHRIYHGAVTAPRGFTLSSDATHDERLAAIAEYYNKMTFDPEMDSVIESVLVDLRQIRDDNDFDSDEYVDLIIKFVQSIPYDYDRGLVEYDSPFLGDPRMPIQVLVDGMGDCDEKVMLLAALLAREGYDTAALFFEAERHMALGIRSETGGFEGTGYEFVETTGITYVSEVPTEFIGGIVLDSPPEVFVFDPSIALAEGQEPVELTGYYSADAVIQVRRIIIVRGAAQSAAEQKREEIESAPLTQAEFDRESALLDACYTAMNGLRPTIDNLGQDTGLFMDRSAAIAWIDRYAWWE